MPSIQGAIRLVRLVPVAGIDVLHWPWFAVALFEVSERTTR